MYKVSQVIEQAPVDFSPSEWISFCNQLKGNTAIAWQFGDLYLDAYDAQVIAFDAYIHQALTGRLNLDTLKRDYKPVVAADYQQAHPIAYAINLVRILYQLSMRLGFTYSGNNPIDVNNDDYIKRTFAPSKIPFHLPALFELYPNCEISSTEIFPSVQDWFLGNRFIVEIQ